MSSYFKLAAIEENGASAGVSLGSIDTSTATSAVNSAFIRTATETSATHAPAIRTATETSATNAPFIRTSTDNIDTTNTFVRTATETSATNSAFIRTATEETATDTGNLLAGQSTTNASLGAIAADTTTLVAGQIVANADLATVVTNTALVADPAFVGIRHSPANFFNAIPVHMWGDILGEVDAIPSGDLASVAEGFQDQEVFVGQIDEGIAIFSTSGADNPAGVGARSIELVIKQIGGSLITVVVATDGTSVVSTGVLGIAVHSMKVVEASGISTHKANSGTIFAVKQADGSPAIPGSIYSIIPAAQGLAHQSVIRVSANETFYPTHLEVFLFNSLPPDWVNFQLLWYPQPTIGTNKIKHLFVNRRLQDNNNRNTLQIPLHGYVFRGGGVLKAVAVPSLTGGSWWLGFTLNGFIAPN